MRSGYVARWDGKEIVAICGLPPERMFVGPWSIEQAEGYLQQLRAEAWGWAADPMSTPADQRRANLRLTMSNELAEALQVAELTREMLAKQQSEAA